MAVEVFEVSASGVLDVEPLGDDGPAFCFFVNDTQAPLLVGQWLLPYHNFPCASFRLDRWADTRKPIRIEPTGSSLTPGHSTVRVLPKHRLKEIQVIEARPETLQEDLDRAFSKKMAMTVHVMGEIKKDLPCARPSKKQCG